MSSYFELGYSEEEIADLEKEGIIVTAKE